MLCCVYAQAVCAPMLSCCVQGQDLGDYGALLSQLQAPVEDPNKVTEAEMDKDEGPTMSEEQVGLCAWVCIVPCAHVHCV